VTIEHRHVRDRLLATMIEAGCVLPRHQQLVELPGVHAPVERVDLVGEVGIAKNGACQFRDLLWPSKPSDGNLPAQLMRVAGGHPGLRDQGWRERIDGDAKRGEADGQEVREAMETGLRRGVVWPDNPTRKRR
jgi:hypothetical protein